MKETFVDKDIPKKIKHIQFGVLSPQEIWQYAEIEICNKDMYESSSGVRKAAKHGCLDPHLGISDKAASCETCGLKLADCVGHFGFLRLELPVFHIGFFKATLQMLQAICKTCSKVLLTESEQKPFRKRLANPNLDGLQRSVILKNILTQCKKVTTCPHCSATNGVVKKIAGLKIIHEKFRSKKKSEEAEEFMDSFQFAAESMPELKPHLGKAMEDLHPLRVLELFKRIPDEDLAVLAMNEVYGRPEGFIWQHLPVPPVCIRPSVAMAQENGSNEDDLTIKLTEIVYTNVIIRQGLESGSTVQNMMEDWDYLQLQTAMYINSDLPGVPSNIQMKPIRGFCQRLKGKQGRFRGNLSGKRVDFSSRTVISPDPNLSIDQVGVPVYVAKTLTYPEAVHSHNIEKLRKMVENGPDVHPGANYVVQKQNGFKKYLRFGDRKKAAESLRMGDVVERHLSDGDIVLFNRQPSLHKLSIMSHFAVVKPWRTFRFNECVCNPYNADFDGDEMNLHLPQTEEARAEAMELMGVKNNLVTPRNGQPIIAATQDFITASFLITNKSVFYDRAEFCQICTYMFDADVHIDLPPPTIFKPVQLWTGKQVISVLLKPNRESKVLVNLENKGRTFSRMGKIPEMCPDDGYLNIHNSQVMCGTLDKSAIGDGNKGSIFYVVLRDYGPKVAAACMNRIAKLCARWLANRGFSIGVNDVQPGFNLRKQKDNLVVRGYSECDRNISEFKLGRLQNQAGCTADETLESVLSGILSKIRDDVGQICLQELSKHNAPLIMQWCGSKGSKINVSQMVACVGQQIISGQRIPDGFGNRSLPHFQPHSKTPPAKGFVRNSFYSGLTPTEFFFHAVSGREGLVDTAVKTAETGYMQRRLMKALEDLSVNYDGSVRSSVGGIVQFIYGDDGLDPAFMEGDDQPVNFLRNFMHCKAKSQLNQNSAADGLSHSALTVDEIRHSLDETLESDRFRNTCSLGFRDSIRRFMEEHVIEPYEKIQNELGCMDIDVLDDKSMTVLHKALMNLTRVTSSQLKDFFDICFEKYMKAVIEPGTAVGALGAQSIGEPGTQMTLKTFHFAGVASMNITLGVPRIKEIINATKNISTPIITANLVNNDNVRSARIVKGRIEKTLLGDICEFAEEVFGPSDCYISLKVDLEAIRALQLEIDLITIQNAIISAPKMKLSSAHVMIQRPDKIKVFAPELSVTAYASRDPNANHDSHYYALQVLKRSLPKVIVHGIPSISRAVINDTGSGKYNLLVEGIGLRQVMTSLGVDGRTCKTNSVVEAFSVLGIEAARSTIINEIQYTMGKHGMTIDARHVMLLGDIMTFKGEVLGITRNGIAKMKDSVLMLASFEKTPDHLFEAALQAKKDSVQGVSECIIMGTPMPVGTGMFKLLHQIDLSIPPPKPILFDLEKYHPKLASLL